MNILFLQDLPFDLSTAGTSGLVGGSLLTNLLGAFVGIFIVFILILFALYLYSSAAYSKIGRKAGLNSPGIAWMPGLGWLAVIFESSKMHWWPFLIMVCGFLLGYILILSVLIVGAIMAILGGAILFATMIFWLVITTIWHWKTYKTVGKPGWWILVPILATIIGLVLAFIGASANTPVVSIFGIIMIIIGAVIHLILIGIAAWSNSSKEES